MDSKKVGIVIGIIGLIVLVIIGILLFGGKKDVYEVTFVNDGSKEVVEVNANDTVSRPAVPTKTGYVFKGWYNGSVEFDFDSKITKDITLTAKWEKIDDAGEEEQLNSYTVEFNSNGGSSVSKQTVKEGKTAIKPANPTRKGYIFKGWYLNGILYDFTTKVTKDINLVAKWEKVTEAEKPVQPEKPVEPVQPDKPEEVKTYTVKFDTAGGSEIANQTVEEGKLATKPNIPTKEGYTFLGWYIGDTEFDFTTKVTKDVTLTAKWEKVEEPEQPNEPEEVKTYTVKFDTDGGSEIANQTVEEGKLATKPNEPTKEGYTFLGWYVGDTEFDFATKITKDITLKATWISYSIEKTNSDVGQVKIFVYKNDTEVDGYVDITLINGTTITNVEISKDGYITNGYRIKSINNVKLK